MVKSHSSFSEEEKLQTSKLMQNLNKIEHQLPPLPFEYFIRKIEKGPSSYKKEIWLLAVQNQIIVGYLHTQWNIKIDNMDLVQLKSIFVEERNRKKGIGLALFTKMLSLLPDEITKISTWAINNTPGQQFMEKLVKNEPSLVFRQSVSEIRKFRLESVSNKVEELVNIAVEKGFSFKYYQNADFSNVYDIDNYIKAYEEIIHDIPIENLTFEKEQYAIERFKEEYSKKISLGYEYHTFAAFKYLDTVGMTDSKINSLHAENAEQEITGVVKKYRGHQIRLTLKYLMLEKLLRATNVKYWVTGNADSNEHMISINNELGHKEWLIAYIYETEICKLNID